MSPTPAAGSLFSRPLIPFTEMIYRFLAPIKQCKQKWRLVLRNNQAVLRFSNITSSSHTPKQLAPTRWNTLSHHRLKQNNTTCCRFTQKRCFHSALSWRLSGSSAKGPLSAFKRVSMAGSSRRSHLCCQHSWSRLQPEDPRKSGISHQRTHHVL